MRQINHDIIGKIVIQKKLRQKRLIIKVLKSNEVFVTMPIYTTYKTANMFIEKNINWIKKQQEKLKQKLIESFFDINSVINLLNKIISFQYSADLKINYELINNNYLISIPYSMDLSDMKVQDNIKAILIEILRFEAKAYLPNRTYDIAAAKNILINKVTVKNIKSRWGSCSSKKNINLSIFLMTLPEKLIDYVIFHELAHIKHQNHSSDFWNHLENLLPGAKTLDKELKKHRMLLN